MLDFPHELLSCGHFILEAKRVILNEQLDKIANMTLSDDHTPQHTDGMLCGYPEIANEAEPEILSEVDDFMKDDTDIQFESHPNNSHPNLELNKIETAEKLDDFITNLKSHQHESRKKSSIIIKKTLIKNYENSESFKNRFKSQKAIIDLQRSKIDEQTKIINELKLGIIREDLIKSIENTKINIREIFSNCSGKLLAQAPMIQAVEERKKMMITSQKVPKTYQKMHQRAIERANYREIILERKRLIEETRQKLLEEAIEKKKVLEEEERKRNLEIISEQRKKERHLQKMRREKTQEYERKFLLATNFHKKLLMQQSFKKVLINFLKSKENHSLATEYYRRKQKYRIFKTWWGHVEAKYKIKEDTADAHCEFRILKRAFEKFKEFKLDCKLEMQVAEDYYDMWLTIHTFNRWHRYACKQIMLERNKIEIAKKHYIRRLLFQFFFQWRTLPAVLQLEKAKNEKKRKWREKVWEILPDYHPPEDV
ncbi:unnamed protein product [Ceutorhynchus assimilis]|uniref:Coiled-coil domain containing 191 n=1 Tax=Ceutorhynchus assimilis TaxID=467358 RepID=A0A9N9MDY5_9CUCU|nr:unnamed protein product [Ceutorhynchus assimilis]